MSCVVDAGLEIIGTWDARSCTIVAFARSAMNRCVAGGIARSCVATRYQDGTDFQAGSPDGEPKASSEKGRCVAHIWSAIRVGTSPAKAVRKPCLVR